MSIFDWLGTPLPPQRAAPEENGPGNLRAVFDAGLAAYAAQDYAAAIDCFKSVLDKAHDDADAHNNLGMSYLALGSGGDAQTH